MFCFSLKKILSTMAFASLTTMPFVYAGVPGVTAFSPSSGAVGTTVAITGTNFDVLPANNIVYFGAVRGNVVSASPTNLLLTVPTGATYAPITVTVSGLTAYSGKPFLPTYPGSGTIDSSSLAPRMNLGAGNGPLRVVIGDLDGDGKPDLVEMNYYDGTVAVYRSLSTNGMLAASSFAAPVVLSIPGAANSLFGLALADLDGDGRLDVVVADWNLNKISIFQNIGSPGSLTSGSFAARVDVSVSGSPAAVAVADLDGDGKPEIITANQSGNTVSILQNIGTGGTITMSSFASPVNFPVGPSPFGVAIVDLDGDGRPDVVTLNQNDSNRKVSILRNTSIGGVISSGSLATAVDLAGADTGETLAVGDLDGDGKQDVIVGSYLGQTIAVYRNIGTPGSITASSFAPNVAFGMGARVHSVAMGDLDGDGKPDLAVVTELPSRLSLFKNQSAPGSFTASSLGSRIDFASGSNAVGVVIGDLDGDSRPDLVFGNFYDGNLSIYRNIVSSGGPPVITAQPTDQTVTVGGTASFIVTASGAPPLSYQWFFNQTHLLTGATNATLTLVNVQLANAGSYFVQVTNLHGPTSSSNALLVVNPPPTNVPVITSFSPALAPTGTNVTIIGGNFGSSAAANTVYFGAVRANVISASSATLTVTVPAGATYAPITVTVNGLTAFAPAPFLPTFLSGGALSASSLAAQVNLGTGNGPLLTAVGDLDGDGTPDLVVLNYYDGTVDVYRNVSTNGTLASSSFASPVVLSVTGAGSSVFGLALADLDGDGRLDILVGDYNLNEISIFQNLSSPGTISSGSFGIRVDVSVSGSPAGLAVADMDGDGKADIVTANQSGNTVSALRNIGSGGTISAGSFAAPVSFAVGSSPWRIAIADMDGDGQPDVVTLNQSDSNHKVSILRNLSAVGSIAFALHVDLAGADTGEALAVGDLDGDGKPDVVVGSYTGRTIAVYRNISTPGSITAGSFASNVAFAMGASVHNIAIGDLDGDGKPDLAVVTEDSSELSLFKNTSTPGSFTTSSLGPRLAFASGNNAVGVVIDDLDGDGRSDLVLGNFYNNTLSLYRNLIPFGGPPAIISQPTDQTAVLGTSATFTASASGSQPLSYQWYSSGTGSLTGATNASLILTNVQDADAAGYSVIVTNFFGSVTSSVAQLIVIDPPMITTQPASRTNSLGTTAIFTVAANGTPPLSYRWRKNGSGMTDAGNVSGTTTATLTLTNVSSSDAADYTMVITNAGGSVTSSVATLTILTPAFITTQPISRTNITGTTATFTVVAGGTAPLTYQWQKNNSGLTDGGNVSGAATTTLTLTNVSPGDAATYNVVVINSVGSVISSNAVLTVNPPPANMPVILTFSPVSGTIGTNVVITGLNFSPTPSSNIVYFGAVKAAVTAASTTSLTATMPAGATYAPLTVTVNGLTAFSSKPFLPTFIGNGTLVSSSLAGRVNFSAGSGPLRIAAGDLDGDGKPDLVVVNYSSGSVGIYRNISASGSLSTGSFAAPVVISIAGASGNLFGLALADLDRDGRLDIVVADYGLGKISIFQNQSSPGIISSGSFAARVDISVSGTLREIAIGDLDGDGMPDIVTANQTSNAVSVLRNIGSGGTIDAGFFALPVNFPTGPSPTGVAIVDLDGDGKPDVVTVNGSDANHKVSILRNTSIVGDISSISFASKVDLAGADTGETLAVGDLDGDGRQDLVLGAYTGQTISVYRNISTPGSITTGSFAPNVAFAMGARVHSIAIGDLDGDGKPDLAVVTELPSRLSLFKNQSVSGGFTASSLGSRVDFASGNNAVGVVLDDLDADGRPDVIHANFGNNNLSIYRNLVPRLRCVPDTITTPTNTPTKFSAAKLAVNDVDLDGYALTVIGVSSSSAQGGTVALASGQVTYTPPVNFAGNDSFTYTISDGHGGTALGTVTATVGSSPVSLNIVFGPTMVSGNFVVRFAGIPGQTYTIEAASSLAGPWTKVANLAAPTTDQGFGVGVFQFSEPVGGNTTRFYRTVYPAY